MVKAEDARSVDVGVGGNKVGMVEYVEGFCTQLQVKPVGVEGKVLDHCRIDVDVIGRTE